MEQHLYKGRGAPDFIPPELNAHYVDLNTKEVYMAGGTSIVDDWGTPLITKSVLQTALTNFANEMSSDNAPIVEVKVKNIVNRGRYATLDPELHAGRFVIITADTDDAFKIEIVPSNVLHLGQTIGVYNSTDASPVIDTYNCQVAYALNNSQQEFKPGAVADIRLIKVNAELPYYLVSGQLEGIQGEGGDAWEDVVTLSLTDGETGPEATVDMQTHQGKFIYLTNPDNLAGNGKLFILNAGTATKAGGRFGLYNATEIDLAYDESQMTPVALPNGTAKQLSRGDQVLGRVIDVDQEVPTVLLFSSQAGTSSADAYWQDIVTVPLTKGGDADWASAEIDLLQHADKFILINNPDNLDTDTIDNFYLDVINGQNARLGAVFGVLNVSGQVLEIDDEYFTPQIAPNGASNQLADLNAIQGRLVAKMDGQGVVLITGTASGSAGLGVMQVELEVDYDNNYAECEFYLDDTVGNLVELVSHGDEGTNEFDLNIKARNPGLIGQQVYVWNNTNLTAKMHQSYLWSEFAIGINAYTIPPMACLLGTVVGGGETAHVLWTGVGVTPQGKMDFDRVVRVDVQSDDEGTAYYADIYPDDVKSALIYIQGGYYADQIDVNISWPNGYGMGEGFYIRNNTGAVLNLRGGDMYLDYAPSVDFPVVPAGGLVNVRYLDGDTNNEATGTQWLASGDIVTGMAASKYDGYSNITTDSYGSLYIYPEQLKDMLTEVKASDTLNEDVTKLSVIFNAFGSFEELAELRLWNNSDLPMSVDVGYYSEVEWCIQASGNPVVVKPRGMITMKCLTSQSDSKRWVGYGDLMTLDI